jgi:hypothetical protein
VEEVPRTQSVRLEVPGLDKDKFQAQEPLLGSSIPESDVAVNTYVLALQRFLKTDEKPDINVDLQHKETVIAFGEGKKVPRRAADPGPHAAKVKLVMGDLTIKGLPREVFEAKILPVEFLDASTRTDPRPNSTTADITITFRNGSGPH